MTLAALDPAPGHAQPRLGRRLGLGVAALGAASLIGRQARAQSAIPTDADYLNFALNFEYLGAQYYLQAVVNQSLPLTLLPANSGAVTLPSGTLVPFANPAVPYYGIRLAADEQSHVQLLQLDADYFGQTQGYAIPQPALNLDTDPSTGAWSLLAQQAGLLGPGQTLDPYASDVGFMLGAYMLEDLRVSVLTGIAAQMSDYNAIYLATGLATVAAMQAGAVRGYLATVGAGVATNAIAALRASQSGTFDIGTSFNGDPYRFADLDDNGIAEGRTPGQALAVAYGGVGRSAGLFFPQGVNGVFAGTLSG